MKGLLTECGVAECREPAATKGLCGPHYFRQHRTGSVGSVAVRQGKAGSLNPKWRGGKSSHPLYGLYHEMVARCHRPTHPRYADYGGRGILVCDAWRADFWTFVADMGDRPPGLSIDRVNNDLGYSPENCRWATRSEQVRNRRPSPPRHRFADEHQKAVRELYESGLTCQEIGDRFGVSKGCVRSVLRELAIESRPAARRTRLDERQQEQVRALYQAGVTQAEIAARFEVTRKVVGSAIRRNLIAKSVGGSFAGLPR